MHRRPYCHTHVRVEGALTKPSAVYVDELAWHIGLSFHKSLESLDAQARISPDVSGLENIAANDIMLAPTWEVVRAWFWKRVAHISVLELAAAVPNLGSFAKPHASVRFARFLDSAVCRRALAEVRSASFALQPGLRVLAHGVSLLTFILAIDPSRGPAT